MDIDQQRRRRAEARRDRIVILRGPMDGGIDASPVRGAEAISLVTRLTAEGWSLAGRDWPRYGRADTSYRFVPGFGE